MPAVQRPYAQSGKQGAGKRPRAKTPNISVTDEYYRDESTLLLDEAKAALGDEAKGMAFKYGSSRDRQAELNRIQGWVPVKTKPQGATQKTKEWRHGLDILLMRPAEKTEHAHAVSAAVAREQLNNTLDAKGEGGISPEAE